MRWLLHSSLQLMAENENSDTFEPGAAQFGNFINYYEFNPPSNRLALFRGSFVEHFQTVNPHGPLVCLDVGCNTGELTRGLAELLSSGRKSIGGGVVHMLGVDLDDQLVLRANEMTSDVKDSGTLRLEFRRLNPVSEAVERDNLWRSYLLARGRSRFDIAFCFSTTMWVHLNHGDEGLSDLLSCLCSWADNVVVEPQPWKCYRSAARRLRRAGRPPFPHYESLAYRSNILDHIDSFIRHRLAMDSAAHLGQSEWNRPVNWYRHAITADTSNTASDSLQDK